MAGAGQQVTACMPGAGCWGRGAKCLYFPQTWYAYVYTSQLPAGLAGGGLVNVECLWDERVSAACEHQTGPTSEQRTCEVGGI